MKKKKKPLVCICRKVPCEDCHRIPCNLSELLSDELFVKTSALLRDVFTDSKRYTRARVMMVENRMIQLIPHGFLSSRPYIHLASCVSKGRRSGLEFDLALLNIGFWVDHNPKEARSLGECEFHVVWSPAVWLELLQPSYLVFVGSYDNATMSLEQIFSSELIVSDGIKLDSKLERILSLNI